MSIQEYANKIYLELKNSSNVTSILDTVEKKMKQDNISQVQQESFWNELIHCLNNKGVLNEQQMDAVHLAKLKQVQERLKRMKQKK